MREETISIREAANIIGVSTDTLRRWDEKGELPAIRGVERGHRRYRKKDIDKFIMDLFYLAKQWGLSDEGEEPEKPFYCANSSVFKTRLDEMGLLLSQEESLKDIFSLITSIAGEIGNNSFDHNLGNWPDISGIYFAYDVNKKLIVLADRGRGILKTLKTVKPELKNHAEALKTAFTEIITGRAPEHRGNGLKFVKQIIDNYPMSLIFQTGNAKMELPNTESDMGIMECKEFFQGCIALIKFDI